MYEAGPVDFRHSPRWRPQTGSSFRSTFFALDALFFDCLGLSKSISIVFQRGGCKLEVVFPSGSRCIRRVFLMDSDCLRVSQSILVVGHTGDRSGKQLPVYCRHGGKRLESTSPTSNSRNSSKNCARHTENRSGTPPLFISHHVGQRSKTTGPTSPDGIV